MAPLDLHVCDDYACDTLYEHVGCPAYVSPEIVQCKKPYSGRHADMWSAGVILYVMIVGRYPFYDTVAEKLFKKIRRGQFFIPSTSQFNSVEISIDARLTMMCLMRVDAQLRPSALALLFTGWLQIDKTPRESLCDISDHVVP